jgi:HAD superfamily hydrolase (TIGR01490 family)
LLNYWKDATEIALILTSVNNLVLFDFDGTLTSRDTLIEFIRYFRGSGRLYLGFVLLSPLLILYKVGLIKNWKMKQMLMHYFFGGTPVNEFQELCNSFVSEKIPRYIRKEALERIMHYKSKGDDVYIISASPENWVRIYSETLSIGCIATRLEVMEGAVTGKILGKNCYGPEKVKRIKALVDISKYASIIAFGDSRGDKEMLALAHESYYRKFY